MEVNYCDVCKKPIENPIPTRSIYRIADIEVCEPCKEDLDAAVKYTVRGRQPFDLGWFEELNMKLLRDGMQKGRILIKR